MEDELEIVGAASAGAVARDINGDGYLQGPCPNCGTELKGEYCWSCGQSAKDMKRPLYTLFSDILNAIVSFDGRLALTMPSLMFRPGHVTRSYLDGKRVRYVPPFRLFLIASVLFFLTLFSLGEMKSWMNGDDLTVNTARDTISRVVVGGRPLGEIEGYETIYDAEGKLDPVAAEAFITEASQTGSAPTEEEIADLNSIIERMNGVTLSRSEIFASVSKWAPRLSFLLLPVTIISLTILHIWIRRIYIYDHVIVALHLQTYIYLAATLAILFSAISVGWAWGLFGVSIPIYLFLLLRKSYDTNWFFNIIRMFGLLASTIIAVFLLALAVSLIGANEVGLITWDDLVRDAASDQSPQLHTPELQQQ